MSLDPEVKQEAIAVVGRYYTALNANNEEGVRDAFHFPHVRIGADGTVKTYPTRSDLRFASFLEIMQKNGWHHSAWDKVDVVFTTPRKAHIGVNFTRYREDNSVIGHYFSLYIVTCHDDKWAIQAGSGDGT